MERTSRRRGPFVCPGDDEDDGPREPGIIEQIDRIRRGLPPVPPTGILAQIEAKTGKAESPPIGGVLGQVAAAKERYREPYVWPRDWDDPGRNNYVSPGVVRGTVYGADRHPLDAALAVRVRRDFSAPGLIRHRGTWRIELLSGTVIIGLEDSLRRIAEDLTGNAADFAVIFPKIHQGVPLIVGERIPLIRIQGLCRAWSKEAWEAAVVNMTWEDYVALAGPVEAGPPVSGVAGVSPEFVRKSAKYTADWEGRRRKAYRDTKGIWTIGIGFNLEARREQISRLLPGVTYDDLISGRVQLNDSQVDMLFARDVAENIHMIQKAIPDFNILPEDVRLVLADMCHQFGSPWSRLSAAIRRRDYAEVIKEIWSDNWVRDTPRRAHDHINIVRQWARQEQLKQEEETRKGP